MAGEEVFLSFLFHFFYCHFQRLCKWGEILANVESVYSRKMVANYFTVINYTYDRYKVLE